MVRIRIVVFYVNTNFIENNNILRMPKFLCTTEFNEINNMDLKNVCRLCLAMDVSTYILSDSPLREVYEKLTNISLNTEHWPVVACYLCYSQLKKCHNLMIGSVRANEVLLQLLHGGEVEGEPIAVINSKALKSRLIVTPIELIAIPGTSHLLKSEGEEKPLLPHFIEEWMEFEESGYEKNTVPVAESEHNIVEKIKKEPPLTKCVVEGLDRLTFVDRLKFEDEEDAYITVPMSVDGIGNEKLIDYQDIIKKEVLEDSVNIGMNKLTDRNQKECILYEALDLAADIDTKEENEENKRSEDNIEIVIKQNVRHVNRQELIGGEDMMPKHLEIDFESNKCESYKRSADIELDGLTDENHDMCILYEEIEGVVHIDTEIVTNNRDIDTKVRDNAKHLERKDKYNNVMYVQYEGSKGGPLAGIEIDGLPSNQRVCMIYEELDEIENIDIKKDATDIDIDTVILENEKHVHSKQYTHREYMMYEDLETEDIDSHKPLDNAGLVNIVPPKIYIQTLAEQMETKTTMTLECKNIMRPRRDVDQKIPIRYSNIRTYTMNGTKKDSNVQVSLDTSSYSDRAIKKCNVRVKTELRRQKLSKFNTGETNHVVGNSKINSGTYRGATSYRCGICRMPYMTQSGLLRHIPTHSGVKLFECSICQIKFSQEIYLMEHYTVHPGNKLYKCHICKNLFQKYKFLKHTKICKMKSVKCNVCNNKYESQKSLNRHFLKHIHIA